MSEPFIAEIRPFAFNFAPRGWALCDGQLLPINQNQSLYALLGTTYGGDGRTSFGLPDIRGRVPVHEASSLPLGTRNGEETVHLGSNEIPGHTHTSISASSDAGTASTVAGNVPAGSGAALIYGDPNNLEAMNGTSLGNTGGNQGHNNMQPFQTLNYCIALQGLFPSRN